MYEFIAVPFDFVLQYKDRRKWGRIENFHTHDCYEFYYLLEGDLTFCIGDKQYNMKKGSIAMVPPGFIINPSPKKTKAIKECYST